MDKYTVDRKCHTGFLISCFVGVCELVIYYFYIVFLQFPSNSIFEVLFNDILTSSENVTFVGVRPPASALSTSPPPAPSSSSASFSPLLFSITVST